MTASAGGDNLLRAQVAATNAATLHGDQTCFPAFQTSKFPFVYVFTLFCHVKGLLCGSADE
jgi:hypothetical protein